MPFVYSVFVLILVTFGAVVMALEILASNLMSPYFGGSIYIWGSIISSFMVHFSLGYVLGGWLSRRWPRLKILAALLVLASLWVLLIPTIHQPICEAVSEGIEDVRLGSLMAMNLLFLVPVSLMAMVSPYLIGIAAARYPHSRFTAGMVLFLSTVGSFVGTNLTAFYLIGLFPVSRIVLGLGSLCLMVSLFVLCLPVDRAPISPAREGCA